LLSVLHPVLISNSHLDSLDTSSIAQKSLPERHRGSSSLSSRSCRPFDPLPYRPVPPSSSRRLEFVSFSFTSPLLLAPNTSSHVQEAYATSWRA
jgi:hypothetical protein